MSTLVRQAIAALGGVFPEVRWAHTGGNCYAIECLLSAEDGPAGGFVLVTDAEDVFGAEHLESDAGVTGFYADEYDIHGDSRTRCEGFYAGGPDVAALVAAMRERFGA